MGVAVALTIAGVVLLFCGFWVKPAGEIHDSVLVAYGEVATFAGALFGVDYSYKVKVKRFLNDSESTKEKEDMNDGRKE